VAIEIKRIEKEYILNALHTKHIIMSSLMERDDYSITLASISKTSLTMKSGRTLPEMAVEPGKKLNLMANYMGMNIFFSVEINGMAKEGLITAIPEALYRSLERASPRQAFPVGMSMQFASLEEKFALPFPLLDADDPGAPLPGLEAGDYNAIVAHLAAWVKTGADGHKLTLFRDAKIGPLELEKSLIMKTGKTLFLPSTEASLPPADETPEKRLVTTEIFTEMGGNLDMLTRFVQARRDEGLRSCVWVPVFFERYAIGYIQLWVSAEDKAPLGIEHIATLYQYGKSLSAALMAKNYFASCSLKNKFFNGNGVDVSASGVLFSYPQSSLAPAFTVDKEIALKLTMGSQTISSSARIIRYYREKAVDYWGCRLVDIAPEDSRTLVEYLYSKPFDQIKTTVMAGQA
jgi:hypothetical protein